MYDALSKNVKGERQDLGASRQEWTTTDESETSPRQENGHDCGMFTLILMSLLQNGLRLRRNLYVHGSLAHRDLHKKLVWTIWKSGLDSKEVR